MTDQDKRKGGGGKLTRTETVTVRLDPKLRYLAELAARKQRRTLSSYIEWAIEDSLKSVTLYQGGEYDGDYPKTVGDEVGRLWDVDQAERFVRLAIAYPELMTHEEQEIWKLLQDSQVLQPAQSRRNGRVTWDIAVLEDQVFADVRLYWPSLMTAYEDAKLDAQHVAIEWVKQTRAKVIEDRTPPPRSPPPGRSAPPSRTAPPKPSPFADVDDDIPF